jgi:hypothetical protein
MGLIFTLFCLFSVVISMGHRRQRSTIPTEIVSHHESESYYECEYYYHRECHTSRSSTRGRQHRQNHVPLLEHDHQEQQVHASRVPRVQTQERRTSNVAESGIIRYEGGLDLHNQIRAQVRSPPLRWSNELADHAWMLAKRYALNNCALPGSAPSASNIYAKWGGMSSIDEAVESWTRNKMGQYTTYTQVIWHSTKNVGCALAYNQQRVCSVVICTVFHFDSPLVFSSWKHYWSKSLQLIPDQSVVDQCTFWP